MGKSVEMLGLAFNKIRTGRAHPSLLDHRAGRLVVAFALGPVVDHQPDAELRGFGDVAHLDLVAGVEPVGDFSEHGFGLCAAGA